MNLLVCADIHGSSEALRQIKKKAKDADVLLVAGDFTVFEQKMESILDMFNGLEIPVIIIPGNHESPDRVAHACKSRKFLIFLNADVYEHKNYLFLGFEGNGFARKDNHFEKNSLKFHGFIDRRKKYWEKMGNPLRYVLITHAPPYKTSCDRLLDEQYCGNQSIRIFIEKTQPVYAVCGHIHENRGTEDLIGKTHVMNPGPFGRIIKL